MIDEDEDAAELDAAITSAVESALREHDEAMVTRWILVAEAVAPDVGRYVRVMTSDDLTSWDALGLLHYGLLVQDQPFRAGG